MATIDLKRLKNREATVSEAYTYATAFVDTVTGHETEEEVFLDNVLSLGAATFVLVTTATTVVGTGGGGGGVVLPGVGSMGLEGVLVISVEGVVAGALEVIAEGTLAGTIALAASMRSNGGNEGEVEAGYNFDDIDNAKIKNQNQLSKEYFDTLTDKGTIFGGRSGEEAPLISDPNSFYKTDAGHIITYNSKGEKVLDISPERVKVWKKNVNPNNPSQVNWSSYKLKNDSGQVEKTFQWILDYFN